MRLFWIVLASVVSVLAICQDSMVEAQAAPAGAKQIRCKVFKQDANLKAPTGAKKAKVKEMLAMLDKVLADWSEYWKAGNKLLAKDKILLGTPVENGIYRYRAEYQKEKKVNGKVVQPECICLSDALFTKACNGTWSGGSVNSSGDEEKSSMLVALILAEELTHQDQGSYWADELTRVQALAAGKPWVQRIVTAYVKKLWLAADILNFDGEVIDNETLKERLKENPIKKEHHEKASKQLGEFVKQKKDAANVADGKKIENALRCFIYAQISAAHLQKEIISNEMESEQNLVKAIKKLPTKANPTIAERKGGTITPQEQKVLLNVKLNALLGDEVEVCKSLSTAKQVVCMMKELKKSCPGAFDDDIGNEIYPETWLGDLARAKDNCCREWKAHKEAMITELTTGGCQPTYPSLADPTMQVSARDAYAERRDENPVKVCGKVWCD